MNTQALQDEAWQWRGTPFVARARVKGKGVDCVNLAAALYLKAGVVNDFNPPNYTMTESIVDATTVVTDYVKETGKFQELPAQETLKKGLKAGDLVCFKLGRAAYHVGVMISNIQFVHVFQGRKVTPANIDDPTWTTRLLNVFRPI